MGYKKFDKDNSWSLDEHECLCMLDAVLRGISRRCPRVRQTSGANTVTEIAPSSASRDPGLRGDALPRSCEDLQPLDQSSPSSVANSSRLQQPPALRNSAGGELSAPRGSLAPHAARNRVVQR